MSRAAMITGLGVASPFGLGAAALREGVLAAERGEGTIPEFDPVPHLGAKGLRILDRLTRFTLIAAQEALQQGRLSPAPESEELGVVVGTAFGPVNSLMAFIIERLAEGPNFVTASLFPSTGMNAPASQVSLRHRGVRLCTTLTSGTASGLDAIGYALIALRRGRHSLLLAGGADELSHEVSVHLERRGVTTASEGAAFLLLESEAHARARPIEPLGRAIGYASLFDPSAVNGTPPNKESIERVMRAALRDAEVEPDQIPLVVASSGEEAEAEVLARVLPAAEKIELHRSLGDALGASGALASVIGLAALRERRLKQVLVNSLSYSGHLSSVVLAAP